MSTYLEVVNNVLTMLNEVNLTSSTFATARGIHSAVIVGVRNAVNEINSQKWEWPFNYATTTQALTVGQELYTFTPADYKIADWESFVIEKQTVGSEEIDTRRLVPMQRQEWYKWRRKRDVDSEATGVRIPNRVFWYGSGGFGVTPSPDAAYVVTYNYWKETDTLTDYDDTISIPENFNWVIEQGCLEKMYVFLDNEQRASIQGMNFKDAIKQMAYILIPQNIADMRDTRVNFGGGQYFSGYGRAGDPML